MPVGLSSGDPVQLERRPRGIWFLVAGLASALALLLLLQTPLTAATIQVDSGCTLVDAIIAANTNFPSGLCPGGSGADTIELTGNVLLTTFHNSVDGDNGLPSIISRITIEGNGYSISRDNSPGVPKFRLFRIGATGNLTLSNTLISGGSAREGGSDTFRGGGAFNRGTLTLVGTTFDSNVTGPGSASVHGGAIYNLGQLALIDSTLSNNQVASDVDGFGGAIYQGEGATLEAENTVLRDNIATGAYARGGAIDAVGPGSVYLSNSTVSGNWAEGDVDGPGLGAAGEGGGLRTRDIALEIIGSTLDTNLAWGQGDSGIGRGGAINHSGATLQMVNSTVSANVAAGNSADGGGLSTVNAVATLTNMTFRENSVSGLFTSGDAIQHLVGLTGWVTLTKSIVQNACAGPIADGGSNLGCGLGVIATDVLPLADYGGPTWTHALSATSSALNTVGACPMATDQRGVSRKGNCDSGAYEWNPCEDAYDDGRETEWEGQDGSDDTCNGPLIALGAPEFHRHCDEDWVFFNAVGGKTYEIKTVGLVNGADTVLETHVLCQPAIVASDDNGGRGKASKIFLQQQGPASIDIRIGEALESYNPGSTPPGSVEGYEIVVTCVEGCDCSSGEGVDLDLIDDAVKTTATYEACSTITLRNFNVGSQADVTLRVGEQVVFEDAITVRGDLRVEIDPLLLP